MTISLPVRDVVTSGNTFGRGRFSLAVMGLLVVSDGEAQIMDDFAAVEEISGRSSHATADTSAAEELSDASIRIADASFLSMLRSTIAPLTSGTFDYFDVAMICGCTRIDGNNLVLDDIWDIIIYRDGNEPCAFGNSKYT